MSSKLQVLELAIEQYHAIKKTAYKGEIRSQIERAALGVCLNLSEGNAKRTWKDKRRFFNISYASQQEVKTLLQIVQNQHLEFRADILAAKLYRLQNCQPSTIYRRPIQNTQNTDI